MSLVPVRRHTRVRLPYQRVRPLETWELETMLRRLRRAGASPALAEAVAALERHRNECQGIESHTSP